MRRATSPLGLGLRAIRAVGVNDFVDDDRRQRPRDRHHLVLSVVRHRVAARLLWRAPDLDAYRSAIVAGTSLSRGTRAEVIERAMRTPPPAGPGGPNEGGPMRKLRF